VGILDLRSALQKSIDIVVTVAMPVLCGTIIRYTCLLIHLVGGDLAGGSRLVYVCFRFGIRRSDQFKDSIVTTSALGRWSSGHVHEAFPTFINNVTLAIVKERR
jgi:hypothetical protein